MTVSPLDRKGLVGDTNFRSPSQIENGQEEMVGCRMELFSHYGFPPYCARVANYCVFMYV